MLSHLLQTPTESVRDLASFQSHSIVGNSRAIALRGGFDSERMGWAFAFGYRAATTALFGQPAAVVISERGGNHPRAIEATLADGVLSGAKSFVTLPEVFSTLAVLARRPDGSLAMGLVATSDATLTRRKPSPFIPEVPHYRADFEGVTATELEEDGWVLSKRFRAQEDIHVTLAALGHLMRFEWDRATAGALLGCAGQLLGVPEGDLDSPGTHVLLGNALARTLDTVRALPLECMPVEARERWLRDMPLLSLTAGVHARRLERAWERLGR